MSLAVVDASTLTAFYVYDGEQRAIINRRLAAGDILYAPAHLDAEISSAIRRLAARSSATQMLAPAALRHLASLEVRRSPLAPLLDRMWQLRASISSYDAAYIALAERIDAPLITCDARLTKANGPRCTFELIP